MCLVAVAWQAHPRYPLILIGNRDEFHGRPSAAADWWPDAPHVFGGRDLQAGGSWLGINRNGRLAVVTNNPLRPSPVDHPLSRGALVGDWLTGNDAADHFLNGIASREERYGGFGLLVGSLSGGLHGFVSPAGALGSRWVLPTGISVLANSPREAPWPKAVWLQSTLKDYLERWSRKPDAALPADELLAMVGRRMPVAPADDDSLRARARVTPFVSSAEYGTRASTLILGDQDGRWQCIEHRYGPNGMPAGESTVRT
ncbi:MAG: NRDE family protein [Gammaproteobacteria bacterium]